MAGIIYIAKHTQVLTDRSKVHDVLIREGADTITISCITERDADTFIDQLQQLIEQHTTNVAR
jgi:hypothetical protein